MHSCCNNCNKVVEFINKHKVMTTAYMHITYSRSTKTRYTCQSKNNEWYIGRTCMNHIHIASELSSYSGCSCNLCKFKWHTSWEAVKPCLIDSNKCDNCVIFSTDCVLVQVSAGLFFDSLGTRLILRMSLTYDMVWYYISNLQPILFYNL